MALSNRRAFGDDRPSSRRSFVDRIQSTLARLSLKQLILLCLVATFLVRIGWKTDEPTSEAGYLSERDTDEVPEEHPDEPVAAQAPTKSWRDQLDDLRELNLPGGTRYHHPVPPSWPDPWPRSPSIAGGWLSSSRFPPPPTADYVDADSPANQLHRKEIGLGTLPIPDLPSLSPEHQRVTAAFFRALVDQEFRVANASRGEAFDDEGRPVKVDTYYDGRRRGWKLRSLKGTVEVPRVQIEYDPRTEEELAVDVQRQEWIRRATLHLWENYKRRSWGHDEVRPLHGGSGDGVNGWGASLFEAMSTLLLVGLDEEYEKAREHIATVDFGYISPKNPLSYPTYQSNPMDIRAPEPAAHDKLTHDKLELLPEHLLSPPTLSVFDTVNRYLGSLISTYDLTHDPLMRQRAVDLADWLLPAFATRSGLVMGQYPLGHHPNGDEAPMISIAEAGSLSLEFTRLFQITRDKRYFEVVSRTTDFLDQWHVIHPGAQKVKALWPGALNVTDPDAPLGKGVYGIQGGTNYDYLLKMHLLLSGAQSQYRRLYEAAASSITKFLLTPIAVVGGVDGVVAGDWHYPPKEEDDEEEPASFYASRLDQASAFASGMLAIGSKVFTRPADFLTAEKLTRSYLWIADATRTGLPPLHAQLWDAPNLERWAVVTEPDGAQRKITKGDPVGIHNSWNLHTTASPAPTVESLFVLWRMTGERHYQEQGWKLFVAWVEGSVASGGFANFHDVNAESLRKDDTPVDSAVFSKTLRYFWLLFAPIDTLSLDDYVFTAGGHPLRIPRLGQSHLAEAPPLWKGEPLEVPEGPIGEGSARQKWAQLQQAIAANGLGEGI